MTRLLAAFLVTFSVVADVPAYAQQSSQQRYKAYAASVAAAPITERYGPDDLRSGQLRLPAGKGPFPVAIVIHGGCWTASYDTLNGIAGVADALTKRGLATWNIEYRRLGNAGAGWPGTFDDIGTGIDHVADLAKRYPLDLSRVTVVGHSAGAHLALWGASRSKLGPGYRPQDKAGLRGRH